MFTFGVELGFHIFYLPFHSKKKVKNTCQFWVGVRVPLILSTFSQSKSIQILEYFFNPYRNLVSGVVISVILKM